MPNLSERQIRNIAKQIDQLGLRMTELSRQIENSGHPYADQMEWQLRDHGFYKAEPIAEGLIDMYLEGGHLRIELDKEMTARIRRNYED